MSAFTGLSHKNLPKMLLESALLIDCDAGMLLWFVIG